jgi:ABC-type Fe3+-hydroxamate transport system substrate-binding protein
MAHILEHRRTPDRRRQPRGGRRPADQPGVAPLILMVGEHPEMLARSEAVLAKLRFGVSIAATADDALRVIPELRPDLVVATDADGARIRMEAPQNVPVVRIDGETRESPEELVEEIRRTLRLYKTG